MIYRYAYGNHYFVNVEESKTSCNRQDLVLAAQDFLDSLPECYLDQIGFDGNLPADWYDSIFVDCFLAPHTLEEHLLGTMTYEYYRNNVKTHE